MTNDLIREAISLRKQGLREKAINLLENYCLENKGDLDMATTLRVWKKEIRAENWSMSRRNSHRSSNEDAVGEWSRFIYLWSYNFSSPFIQKFLPDIPSSIIANDMVIVPNSTLQSFLGIRISDGLPLACPNILGGRLSYASTPVYVNPFLIFALSGALYQISFDKEKLSSTLLISDPNIELVDYCAPMMVEEVAVFGFRRHILLYKPKSKEARFIPYRLAEKDDRLLSPLQWEKEAVFLSRFGQILRVLFNDDLGKANLSVEEMGKELNGTICAAPCLLKDKIYFESLTLEGLSRKICEYSLLEKGNLRIGSLEEGVCSPENTRLYFPSIVFQDGVIFSSDLEPRLYYVQGGHPMRITPIDVKIQKGNLGVYQISHVFAFVLGSHLIGKIPKGFFSVDLLHPEKGTIDIFRPETEIIGQSINSGHHVLFTTKTGVRCYIVN